MNQNEPFKILVVDDFEIVRSLLKNALRDLGYTDVDEAEDGKEALELLEAASAANAPYQLMFCDWSMPNLDGLSVLKICRASDKLSGLPIVMVTAEQEKSSIVEVFRAGANDYIIKPISIDELRLKVQKIVTGIRPA